MQKSTLKLEELPKREKSISIDDISKIFGGCLRIGWTCRDKKDCCAKVACWFGVCAL